MKYVLYALSVAIGILVVALKLQGSKLHKAEMNLLLQTINQQNQADAAKIVGLKAKLSESIRAYIEAGGSV